MTTRRETGQRLCVATVLRTFDDAALSKGFETQRSNGICARNLSVGQSKGLAPTLFGQWVGWAS
jgi:hypothetical protein